MAGWHRPSVRSSRRTNELTRLQAELDDLLHTAETHTGTVRVALRRSENPTTDDLDALTATRAPAHLHGAQRMKKIFGITLGILTAIGGFVDIGDLVANAADRRPLRHVAGLGRRSSACVGIVVYAEMAGRVAAIVRAGRCSTSCASGSAHASALVEPRRVVLHQLADADRRGRGRRARRARSWPSVNYLLWIPLVGARGVARDLAGAVPSAWRRCSACMGLALHRVRRRGRAARSRLGTALPRRRRTRRSPTGETPLTYVYYAHRAVRRGDDAVRGVLLLVGRGRGEVDPDGPRASNRANVFVGFPLGGLLSLALMARRRARAPPARHRRSTTLSQVALPIGVALGKVGLAFVIVGIFAATFGAALETALSAGYTIVAVLRLAVGQVRRGRATRARFHLVVLLSIVRRHVLVGADRRRSRSR